jgi:hypothetical protein
VQPAVDGADEVRGAERTSELGDAAPDHRGGGIGEGENAHSHVVPPPRPHLVGAFSPTASVLPLPGQASRKGPVSSGCRT